MLLLAAALGDAPPAAPSAAASPSSHVFVFDEDAIVTICFFEPPSWPRIREPLPIRSSFEDRLLDSPNQL